MDLKSILSDTSPPARTEPAKEAESVKDDKPADLSADVRSEKEMQAEEIAEREPAAPSAAQEPEKVEPEAKAKDDKPSEVKAEEDEPTTERARDEKGRFVPQQALHAERLKRQELQTENAALKAAQAKPPTSVLENEDLAFQERLHVATQPILAKFFNLSVKIAKKGHEDWDPVAEAFVSAANGDDRLWKSYQEADDPGEYVYAVGKQLKELAEVGGDIVKYGEQKRAEGRGEYEALAKQFKAIKAEIEALKESREKQAQIPQSLNGEQSSPTKAGTYQGPRSLKEIISS